ncbi:MAG: hypothetical protein JSR55_10575 [Proteobacteria bacterium]|nr:hypothetical protein [Pseudomonadota bacterium]
MAIEVKILILHGIDSVATARRTSIHHAFFLPRHQPGHEYWLQAAQAPVTDTLRNEEFDAVIIDTTFLCWRWTGAYFNEFKRKYDFVRDINAVKIAFPQDEYDHSEILETWLIDWKVDIIYSVCYDDRDVFYPTLKENADIRLGYTGFFEQEDIELVANCASPWDVRTVDVGYRAKQLPPYFGWFGKLKSDIAASFLEAARPYGISTDISCRLEDAFMGDEWLKFLGQCRFILGCESGSSVLDPRGEIKAKCNDFLGKNPEASFTVIADSCFPNEDRSRPFTAISPRLFEAAAAGCGQILVYGDYGGVLKPWQHYLPLAPDASNILEIVSAMNNTDQIKRMINASQRVLLGDSRFSYKSFAADVIESIQARRPDLRRDTFDGTVSSLLITALKNSERWANDYNNNSAQISSEKTQKFLANVQSAVEISLNTPEPRFWGKYAIVILVEIAKRILRVAKRSLKFVFKMRGI